MLWYTLARILCSWHQQHLNADEQAQLGEGLSERGVAVSDTVSDGRPGEGQCRPAHCQEQRHAAHRQKINLLELAP